MEAIISGWSVPVTAVDGADGLLPEGSLTVLHHVPIVFIPPVVVLLPTVEPVQFQFLPQAQAAPGQHLKPLTG